MLRGIDKRDIFLDDEDRKRFIERVIKVKESGKLKIYGYCLMDNHVHMRTEGDEGILSIWKLSRVLGIGKIIVENAIRQDRRTVSAFVPAFSLSMEHM